MCFSGLFLSLPRRRAAASHHLLQLRNGAGHLERDWTPGDEPDLLLHVHAGRGSPPLHQLHALARPHVRVPAGRARRHPLLLRQKREPPPRLQEPVAERLLEAQLPQGRPLPVAAGGRPGDLLRPALRGPPLRGPVQEPLRRRVGVQGSDDVQRDRRRVGHPEVLQLPDPGENHRGPVRPPRHPQRLVPDSCEEEPGPRRTRFPKFILISSSVTLLTLCLLLLSLWRLQRVKKLLVPSVPDPKGKFPGLFEQHQGNFQAWITDTQNVVLLAKAGGLEPETPPEEALVIHLLKTEPEAPASPGPACLQTGEEEAPGGSPQLPPQAPQGGDRVFLGDFAFVMSDNSYMML
ncbi:uncharacterized protein [Marmota flaviventris]|uniref:uncharacterized protein isoform X2 n=1 Tax=Marmota flaviventris TaxID=93162 RepID=UPI003A864B7A